MIFNQKAHIKSFTFDGLFENTKIYPPGVEHMLHLETTKRTIQMIPTSWVDYENWKIGLDLLLKEPEEKERNDLIDQNKRNIWLQE